MSELPVRMLRFLACLTAVGLTACGTPQGSPSDTSGTGPSGTSAQDTTVVGGGPTTSPSPTPRPLRDRCAALVETLPLTDRVGQLFMVGKATAGPVDEAYARMLRDTRTGQVVLLGNSTAGLAGTRRLTDDLRGAAPSPAGVQLLVAVDQEGGRVQRLQGPGFDTIPPATEQALLSDADLAAAATRWGTQLKQAGVDMDLAPVADPVPAERRTTNEPIGRLQRQYGDSADAVGPKITAVIRGFHEAGLSTSLKHFPGLGHVVGNTDFSGGVTDTAIDSEHDDLRAFAAGIAAGADSVMVSTATYERIDPASEATFSRAVVTDLLRDQLEFDGVIISDDLGAAQQVADIAPGERAVRFLTAGGDVVINGDPALQATMVDAVLAKAESDPDFAADVSAKATRVVTLKARHGGADCG